MLSHLDHNFLFASLDSNPPSTARKVHIRRLYDIFQLSILHNDILKAKRAWAILARCKEIGWLSIWTMGLHLLNTDDDNTSPEKLDFLRAMMLRCTEERERILQELVFCFILQGQHRNALNELELYLPSFPFQDNAVLHLYAGLISLYLAQLDHETGSFDAILLRDAKSHLEHSKALDPENVVTRAFIQKIPELQAIHNARSNREALSEDDDLGVDNTTATGPMRKRAKT